MADLARVSFSRLPLICLISPAIYAANKYPADNAAIGAQAPYFKIYIFFLAMNKKSCSRKGKISIF